MKIEIQISRSKMVIFIVIFAILLTGAYVIASESEQFTLQSHQLSEIDFSTSPINAQGGLIIESRTSDPPNPEIGRIWLRTDIE
tara:strand:- start:37 stop:288 length:252 start_codon:yes stop_codon:yes gene_type:complete